jgi:trans-aconitate 2-methyltransferase
MSWSARQYTRFESERNRPVVDLLAHIPTAQVATAADIGCGPGNSTELLLARYPNAKISGMDSSADMVAAARKRLPGLSFDVADIETWSDAGPFDVILANASLQWVPDHERIFPMLVRKLAPGGSLAVQMPDNLDEPAHVSMREIAASGPWRDKLSGASGKRAARHDSRWYYELLQGEGMSVDVWRTTYHHRLAGGAGDVVEWFKGTGLQPFLNPLDEQERVDYLSRYQEAVSRAYPALADGSVLLPFPRLFIVAMRPPATGG